MDDWELRYKLREMGMSCFVKYFREFDNPKLSRDSVMRILRENEGYTEGSCALRTDFARNIIVSGRSGDALQLITLNPNIDYRIKQRAKAIADGLPKDLPNDANTNVYEANTQSGSYQAGYQEGYQSGYQAGYEAKC